MPPRVSELLSVRVTAELDQRITQMAESMGYERPELLRILLEHATNNPPDWVFKLIEARTGLRESVS